MGIDAITHRDNGTPVPIPSSSQDWREWVSAGRTRNWMLDDPLLDWLQLYGQDLAFLQKEDLEQYDPNLDFEQFIFEKGRQFEASILDLLRAKSPMVAIAQDYRDILSLQKAREDLPRHGPRPPHNPPGRLVGRGTQDLRGP